MDLRAISRYEQVNRSLRRKRRPVGSALLVGAAVVILTTAASPTSTAAQANVIRFPDGTRIIDIRFANGSYPRNPWHLDGSPDKSGPPIEVRNGRPVEVQLTLEGGPKPLSDGTQTVAVVVRLGDILPGDGTTTAAMTGTSTTGSLTGMPETPHGTNVNQVEFTFQIPKSLRTADLKIGESLGDYKPIATSRKSHLGQGNDVPTPTDPHELGISYDNTLIRFAVPAAARGSAMRLVAYDGRGQKIPLKLNNDVHLSAEKGRVTGEVWCDKLPPELDHFALEVSDCVWKTMKDVHLFPKEALRP